MEKTVDGDFVLYHGTDPVAGRTIVNTRVLRPDGVGAVGVGPSPEAVRVYGLLKAGADNVVVRLVLDRWWVRNSRVKHEIGGSGKNQWLFVRPHKTSGPWEGIPSWAVVDAALVD